MIDERKATRVGAVVLLFLIASVVIALTVDLRSDGPTIGVDLLMDHSGPLRVGARVQLGGRRVGSVQAIRLVTAQEASSEDHLLHPDGGVLVSVRLRRSYLNWLRKNSEFFINANGLIGASYLEVAPPPGSEEWGRKLRDGDQIRGKDPARMAEVIVTSYRNTRTLRALLDDLRPSAHLLRSELAQLRATLDEVAPKGGGYPALQEKFERGQSAWERFQQGLEDSEIADAPESLFTQARRVIRTGEAQLAAIEGDVDRLLVAVERIQASIPDDVEGKLRFAVARMRLSAMTMKRAIANTKELARRVRLGSGTVGALMNDPEFAEDAKTVGRHIKRHPWELLLRPLD